MITSLRGHWEEDGPGEICIDISGIGFQVFVPEHLSSKLPYGEEITLSIYTYVREDHLLLYGFIMKEERELFKELLSVSRIGPSVALKILSNMGVHDFIQSILTDDVAALQEIPGIGKKTAQRMILDLKTRLEDFSLPSAHKRESVSGELISGLTNLGYNPKEAREAILKVMEKDKTRDEESILRLALKELAKN